MRPLKPCLPNKKRTVHLSPFFLTPAAGVALAVALVLSGVPKGQSADALVQNNYPGLGPVPLGYTGKRFRLRQDYPIARPAPENAAWKTIPYKDAARSGGFLLALRDYCFAGNITADVENCFRVEDIGLQAGDPRRRWYHAPFMHAPAATKRGREGFHGLTAERVSQPQELDEGQNKSRPAFAVAFYNNVGASELGRIWNILPQSPNPPRIDQVNFPAGTVCFKLLFTTASAHDDAVGYLVNAPTWKCNALVDDENGMPERKEIDVRLLQVDVAVKVRDTTQSPAVASDPGWVFGTLQYNGFVNDPSPWKRLTPVSLTWGEGDSLPPQPLLPGAAPWPRTTKVWINRDAPWVRYRVRKNKQISVLGGANGPADDPQSSCLQCHRRSTISVPGGPKPLDYSLQLAMGVKQFFAAGGSPRP